MQQGQQGDGPSGGVSLEAVNVALLEARPSVHPSSHPHSQHVIAPSSVADAATCPALPARSRAQVLLESASRPTGRSKAYLLGLLQGPGLASGQGDLTARVMALLRTLLPRLQATGREPATEDWPARGLLMMRGRKR